MDHNARAAACRIADLNRTEMFSLILHLADDLATARQIASNQYLDTESHQKFAMQQILSLLPRAVEFAKDSSIDEFLGKAHQAH